MFARIMSATSVVVVLAILTVSVEAQGGKDKKKDAAKKDTVSTTAAGSVEIYKGKDGYRWRVKGPDGKVDAMPVPSASWGSAAEARKAVDELKAILNKTAPVEVK